MGDILTGRMEEEVGSDGWHILADRSMRWRDKQTHQLGEDRSKKHEEDLIDILETKEKDSILAAELGKSLLVKQEELIKQNECISKEYSEKAQVIH